MSTSYVPRHCPSRPWMAKGRIYDRGVNKDRTQGLYAWTKRDVFLGYFATKEEAEQAVREWREKRKNSR